MSTLHLIGSRAMDTLWSACRCVLRSEIRSMEEITYGLLVRKAEMAPTICRSIRKEAGKMSRAADGVRARRRSDRQDTGEICDVS